jgi:hypothetical protein
LGSHKSRLAILIASVGLYPAAGYAELTISSDPTQNVSCSGGICAPTASKAVLNVTDLENLLNSGSVEVTTTGSGVEATDIHVVAPFGWTSSSTLSLEAYRSISIGDAVTVSSSGGIAFDTAQGNGKGILSFGNGGRVVFQDLASGLSINNVPFTLVNSVATLAAAIKNNPSAAVALADNYDASGDGTYSTSPVSTSFAGTFEGLGNAIANLTISDDSDAYVALFAQVAFGGTVRDVGITNASITLGGHAGYAAALVGANSGQVTGSYATGKIFGNGGGGGLVGSNDGTISESHASADVSSYLYCGGLVGYNAIGIQKSYATGTCTGEGGDYTGGLVGENATDAYIDESFATGAVSGNTVGGLVGYNEGYIALGYADGSVTGESGAMAAGGLVGENQWPGEEYVSGLFETYSTGLVTGQGSLGGLIGYVQESAPLRRNYWDRDTSGISSKGDGVGNIPHDHGIKGITTRQFQAGLPEGFGKNHWAENAKINDGLPYLTNNPPPK